MSLILVIDLGTTFLKAALFEDGRMLSVARRPAPLLPGEPDRCEIDPLQFQNWVGGGIAELREAFPDEIRRIDAVTFSTQTNSFTLLDAADRPLTPLILWSDPRTTESGKTIHDIESLPEFRRTTGIPALTSEFAVSKLLWLHRHQPETMRRARQFCSISDFLTLLLTGRHVTEAGVAGLTGLLNIHDLTWWNLTCERVGLPITALPALVRAGTDQGEIRSTVAHDWGLPSGCRMIIGSADQYAGAIGTGCVSDGMMCETTGTVLATVRCRAANGQANPAHVFEGPGFDPRIVFQMAFGSTSANLLEHYHGTLSGGGSLDDLSRAAAKEPIGAGGVVVHPWRAGEPIESCFADVSAKDSPARVVRAIMETVAVALQQQVNSLSSPGEVQEIRSAGGGARSDTWLQIKADLLGIPMLATACPEPTSLGAALLAAQSLGEGTLLELSQRWCMPRRRFEPDANRHAEYAALPARG